MISARKQKMSQDAFFEAYSAPKKTPQKHNSSTSLAKKNPETSNPDKATIADAHQGQGSKQKNSPKRGNGLALMYRTQ